MGTENLRDALRTFCSVFPAAAAYFGGGDLVLVGGEELRPPRHLTGGALWQLRQIGAEDLSRLEVARRDRLVRAAGEGPILVDDSLRLEFRTPRHVDNHDLAGSLEWVLALWQDAPKPYGTMLRAQIAEARGDRKFWDLLRQAQEEAPRHAYVERIFGEACLLSADDSIRAGDLDDAVEEFRLARGYLAGDVRLIGLEAELRAAQGNREAAIELFERLLALDPDSRYLKRRIAALRGE